MTGKNTILLASPRIPSKQAKSGGQSVLLGMINYYINKYNIFIITRYDPDELKNCYWLQKRGVKGIFIKKYNSSNRLLKMVQKLKSWLVYYYYINTFSRIIRPDYIQLEWVESMFLSFIPRNIRVILDTHDINYILRSRRKKVESCGIVMSSFYSMLKRFEIASWNKADIILARSNYDADIIRKNTIRIPVSVVSLPIKTELLDYRWKNQESKDEVLFVGELDRTENHDSILYFCKYIWPKIIHNKNNLILRIVGKSPRKELINIVNITSSIVLEGFVEDLIPYYLNAKVFIAPLLIGGGVIVKIVDAMTIGIPTITTKFGNQGIGATHDEEIIVLEINKFAEGIVSLIENEHKLEKLSEKSKLFVKRNYNFDYQVSHVVSSHFINIG